MQDWVQPTSAILTVKSFDEQRRVFSGIATTPTPDRSGDIVEPLGVSFKNPLPLLFHHDSTKPIGTVNFGKVTRDGIPFEATIPSVKEPGVVKERTDEAWHCIVYRLMTGASIGLRGTSEHVKRLATGGLHFLKSEVFEMSLVTIPMNADAVIQTVKSLDVGRPAASGIAAADIAFTPPPTHPSGVSDIPRTKKAAGPMTTVEKMTAFSAEKEAMLARLNAIANNDDGSTMDAAATEEFDTLNDKIKSIDADLARLSTLEALNKASAKPVDGTSVEKGAQSRAGYQQVQVTSRLPPGIEFARYAMCLAAAKGMTSQALEIAKARYPDQTQVHEVLKSAVSAGTTTDPTWAGPLVQYQNFAGDFVEFLRPQTIIGKFGQGGIPDLRHVPFNIRIPTQTSGGSAYWVGQGAPKPLTKFDFDSITLLWAKIANIAVLTQELVRFSSPSAEALTRDSLAAAIIAKMDTDFVDPAKAAVTNVSPASITNGLTPVPASGTTAAAARLDVQALFAQFVVANVSAAGSVWIMSASTALSLSMMQNALGEPAFPGLSMSGGTFSGLPVIVSEYLASGSPLTSNLILVKASDIFLADDGQVVIDVSREASLQMDDAPTNNSATPTPTSVVSMFQTNSLAIRAERFVNWARRRDESVAYISGAAYTA